MCDWNLDETIKIKSWKCTRTKIQKQKNNNNQNESLVGFSFYIEYPPSHPI